MEYPYEIDIEAHVNCFVWEKWASIMLEGLVSRTQ